MCRVVTEIHSNRLRGPSGAVAAAAIQVAAARQPTRMKRLLQRLELRSNFDQTARPAAGIQLRLLHPLKQRLCCAGDPGSNRNYRRPALTFATLARILHMLGGVDKLVDATLGG